jgi:hypothetical protein
MAADLESFALARDGGLRLVLVWRVSAAAPAAWSEVTRADTLLGADGAVVKMELAVWWFT